MSSRESGARRASATSAEPSLAAGYLAALPLFLAYELGLLFWPAGASRSSAERTLAWSLSFLGERVQPVRVLLLLALAALAFAHVRRAGLPGGSALGRTLGRAVLEGMLAGFLLGPVLVALQAWLAAAPLQGVAEGAAAAPPSLPAVLRLVGAAPWEELLFRVGLYGGLFLLVRRALVFLGSGARSTLLVAELGALLGSSVLFAAFHLAGAQRPLGLQGEPFHAGLFVWRVSAGILLAGLFRWRGFGVAAWAHAVFNLGLALGIRP